jgi:hypothetical protein
MSAAKDERPNSKSGSAVAAELVSGKTSMIRESGSRRVMYERPSAAVQQVLSGGDETGQEPSVMNSSSLCLRVVHCDEGIIHPGRRSSRLSRGRTTHGRFGDPQIEWRLRQAQPHLLEICRFDHVNTAVLT